MSSVRRKFQVFEKNLINHHNIGKDIGVRSKEIMKILQQHR